MVKVINSSVPSRRADLFSRLMHWRRCIEAFAHAYSLQDAARHIGTSWKREAQCNQGGNKQPKKKREEEEDAFFL